MRIGKTVPAIVLAVLATAPARAEVGAIPLPSGREVAFHDVIWGEPGPAGLTVRFRFLEPDLAVVLDQTPYDELEADMAFLCDNYALERIASTGPQPSTIMISISDRPVEFGAPDPEASQVFEAYRAANGACVWEGF